MRVVAEGDQRLARGGTSDVAHGGCGDGLAARFKLEGSCVRQIELMLPRVQCRLADDVCGWRMSAKVAIDVGCTLLQASKGCPQAGAQGIKLVVVVAQDDNNIFTVALNAVTPL